MAIKIWKKEDVDTFLALDESLDGGIDLCIVDKGVGRIRIKTLITIRADGTLHRVPGVPVDDVQCDERGRIKLSKEC